MLYEWDILKNETLQRTRGISFEEIVSILDSEPLLGKTFSQHYPQQTILLIKIDEYVWAIPTEQRGNKLRLITAYKSRTLTKKYL